MTVSLGVCWFEIPCKGYLKIAFRLCALNDIKVLLNLDELNSFIFITDKDICKIVAQHKMPSKVSTMAVQLETKLPFPPSFPPSLSFFFPSHLPSFFFSCLLASFLFLCFIMSQTLLILYFLPS